MEPEVAAALRIFCSTPPESRSFPSTFGAAGLHGVDLTQKPKFHANGHGWSGNSPRIFRKKRVSLSLAHKPIARGILKNIRNHKIRWRNNGLCFGIDISMGMPPTSPHQKGRADTNSVRSRSRRDSTRGALHGPKILTQQLANYLVHLVHWAQQLQIAQSVPRKPVHPVQPPKIVSASTG
eukprot:TRINITY_DN14277_c0_g1_i1.p1 TRINITY_DN14277_c0_g1~~TRINITY_DN14277_c0_g1_i1.p1  ORF type:complete len:180 (-),score=1.37 TRINITY_DN14277_c0_g1_i1:367-906(-)